MWDRLLEVVTGSDARLLAVIDAAHFEFLQDELFASGLAFDPLYLDEVDAPSLASGPHLVPINTVGALNRLRGIIGDSGDGCVWWVWPDHGDARGALYRHLRKLNMMEIPNDRYDQYDEDQRGPGFERVLFRHADPNVVLSVLHVLKPGQRRRFFGRATALILYPSAFGDLREIEADALDTPATQGILRLSPRQYEDLRRARRPDLRRFVENYVRKATPEREREHDSDAFHQIISDTLETCRTHKITDDLSACRAALMAFATGGSFLQDDTLAPLLQDVTETDSGDMRIEHAFSVFRAQLDA